jgi:hypothetical protein
VANKKKARKADKIDKTIAALDAYFPTEMAEIRAGIRAARFGVVAKAARPRPADPVAVRRAQLDRELRAGYATDPDPQVRLQAPALITKAVGTGPVAGRSAFELIADPNDKAQWNRAFDLDHGLAR